MEKMLPKINVFKGCNLKICLQKVKFFRNTHKNILPNLSFQKIKILQETLVVFFLYLSTEVILKCAPRF